MSVSSQRPERCVSANFTTPACFYLFQYHYNAILEKRQKVVLVIHKQFSAPVRIPEALTYHHNLSLPEQVSKRDRRRPEGIRSVPQFVINPHRRDHARYDQNDRYRAKTDRMPVRPTKPVVSVFIHSLPICTDISL